MHRNGWTLLPIIAFIFFTMTTYGQDISFGFKAGLSNATISGPLETLPNGEKLENYNANKSFVLSLLFNVNFTDEFLLQSELMYNQKGYNYQYDGPSYAIRSEEHTSELQSRGHLVCLLLLEKKMNNRKVN